MTQETGTNSTYDFIGNREDLTDVIYMISPTKTPFLSGIGKAKARATLHEWQVDALNAAANNARIEGDAAAFTTLVVTTRLGNRTQISDKIPRITGTQEAVDKAGRDSEMAYQLYKCGLELKRDMEKDLLSNTAAVSGNDSTARKSAGVLAWLAGNQDKAGDGAAPTTSGGFSTGGGTRTFGTARAFTETLLKNVLSQAFNNGGEPDTIMVSAFNKQAASTFTGNATRMKTADDKTLVAAIDIYDSDFGDLKIVPNRFQDARAALVLEMEKWAIAYLRPMKTYEIARTGDNMAKQLLCEYCLESRNELSSGVVADISTS